MDKKGLFRVPAVCTYLGGTHVALLIQVPSAYAGWESDRIAV